MVYIRLLCVMLVKLSSCTSFSIAALFASITPPVIKWALSVYTKVFLLFGFPIISTTHNTRHGTLLSFFFITFAHIFVVFCIKFIKTTFYMGRYLQHYACSYSTPSLLRTPINHSSLVSVDLIPSQ